MGMTQKVYYATGAVILGFTSIAYIYYKQYKRKKIPRTVEDFRKNLRPAKEAFDYLDIEIVFSGFEEVIRNLRSRCEQYKAIGFDCEWVTGNTGRRPVSLLQLSTADGYCTLFRLHLLDTIPRELIDLLADRNIYKVGVAPHDDAKYLRLDYNINVNSTLDVRHLVEAAGERAGGLGQMSQNLLHVTLDKRRKTQCSDWEVAELTPTQIHYAASDAHSAILIFVHIIKKLNKRSWSIWRTTNDTVWERVYDICDTYKDLTYKTKRSSARKEKNGNKGANTNLKKQLRGLPTRSKPLYDNCYMKAPDGELLCTCDIKKALWYVSKGLAELETKEPMTVRLKFEPAARSIGEVGRFYQIEKENKCVVCGNTNSFTRKNVVPREYRKFFPELMKDHSSHDVLLLCVGCHRRSNTADQSLRYRLAEMCDAPITSMTPFSEERTSKSIRMAARALLLHGRQHKLPEERRKELEAVILNYYSEYDELTEELLKEASTLFNMIPNKNYPSEKHGQKVVEYFMQMKMGLLELESLWRRHFIQVMDPKHLPELWSVTHNEERLYVKYKNGRINDEDLKTIGIKNYDWLRTESKQVESNTYCS